MLSDQSDGENRHRRDEIAGVWGDLKGKFGLLHAQTMQCIFEQLGTSECTQADRHIGRYIAHSINFFLMVPKKGGVLPAISTV